MSLNKGSLHGTVFSHPYVLYSDFQYGSVIRQKCTHHHTRNLVKRIDTMYLWCRVSDSHIALAREGYLLIG